MLDRQRVEEQLVALAAVGAELDPVPPEAFEAAVASFAWRNLDAELAELVFDSANLSKELVGVRATKTTRQLTFETPDLAVELEVDDQADCQLLGQLVPPGAAEIEIRSPRGSVTVEADERGRFWAPAVPGHVVSLRIRPLAGGAGWITTPWVTLLSSSCL